MAGNVNLTVKDTNGIRTLELTGDLKGDMEIRPVKAALDAEVERGARQFVIDLSRVGLVNSLGIGILVACLTSVRKRGGDVKLAGASRRVLRALEHCRLLDVVEHFEHSEEARESFRRQPA
jgi:anti-sigma B factor antagonist